MVKNLFVILCYTTLSSVMVFMASMKGVQLEWPPLSKLNRFHQCSTLHTTSATPYLYGCSSSVLLIRDYAPVLIAETRGLTSSVSKKHGSAGFGFTGSVVFLISVYNVESQHSSTIIHNHKVKWSKLITYLFFSINIFWRSTSLFLIVNAILLPTLLLACPYVTLLPVTTQLSHPGRLTLPFPVTQNLSW